MRLKVNDDMSIKRIYDTTIQTGASAFPQLDLSDAVEVRAVLKTFGEAALASGIERPTDNSAPADDPDADATDQSTTGKEGSLILKFAHFYDHL